MAIKALDDAPSPTKKDSKEKNKLKRVEFSEKTPKLGGININPKNIIESSKSFKEEEDDLKFDKMNDLMEEDYFKDTENKNDESSLSLFKCNSEYKAKVSLRQEILEQAFNTHEDEY